MSKKDINAKLMHLAGFEPDPYLLNFKDSSISYWINKRGVRVITHKTEKVSLQKLVNDVINYTSFLVREKLKQRISNGSPHEILSEKL